MRLRRVGGCLLGLAALAQLCAQSLPEGKGRAAFERVCSNCHGVEVVTKMHMAADQWAAVVDDMVSRGAQGTDDEFTMISDYLSANFGPKAGGAKAAAGEKVHVNSLTARQLADALGISSRDAGAIVQYRKDKGAFKDWPDLRKVPDIDLKKLEEQKDRLSFDAAGESPK